MLRLTGLFLLAVATVCLLAASDGRLVRKKSQASRPTPKRGGRAFGDRKPWEERQDTYSWDFREADFFTKIRGTWDNNHVGDAEEAFAKPLCGTLNASAEATYYGKWHTDAEGHYWWEPQKCRLRRLSVGEARQCLAGRHLFLGGDSLTRYQYLSLVSFLSKGSYMAPWGHGDVRSLAVEREWDGWDDFFKSGSYLLQTQAVNASAKEACDCHHGSYGGFNDVPSHEIRDFTLRDFPTLDGKTAGNLIRVSNKLVYNNPSHIQAGIETLMFAMRELPQRSTLPDAVILNMGIWVRDWSATGDDYKGRFQIVMQHGNYFSNKTKSGHAPRLLWKSTTNTVGDVVEEEAWNAVNEGSLRAVESTPPWQLYDIRALSRQSLEQRLNLYSFDAVHFAPVMYQEFNDFLLNILCSPDLQFQTDSLPPPKAG